MNSKQKGARGEREARDFLRGFGYQVTRGRQYHGRPDAPDLFTANDPILQYLHIEVKFAERFSPYKALEQATNDAGSDQFPIVLHRRKKSKWIVVLDAEDFFGDIITALVVPR